jgi:DNA-binding FrmR family transcriptional regulator
MATKTKGASKGARPRTLSKGARIYLDQPVKLDLLHRLSRLEGHVRGVRRMVEEEVSCDDLLIQISAVRAAINQVGAILLENHLETCVAPAFAMVRATSNWQA